MAQNKQILHIEGAEDFYQSLLKNSPDWYVKFREESKAKASEITIPTVKDEEWKYTSLALLADYNYRLPTHHEYNKEDSDYWKFADKDALTFVMVNGCFISSLSNVEGIKGLKACHLKEAVDNGEVDEKYFDISTSNDIEPFTSANNAFHRCGAYLKIDKSFDPKKVIHIIHLNTADEAYAICPRSLIIMESSAEATVLESFVAKTQASYFVNALTDVHLANNSILHYTKLQNESLNSVHIGQTRVWQERDSRFDGFSFMQGARLTRNNVTCLSQGEGADSTINGLYLQDGKQHVDNHTLIHHQQPNCTSHQLYKGILRGESRAVFNGKIYVDPIAQLTNSYQLNKNLLLGTDCRVDTKPQLEIGADDVKCSHGATIGQLNEDEVFYLQTRCVPRNEAVEMLCRGFIDDIINHVENETVRSKLNSQIQ